ncbi:MAG: acyltransferase [Aquihabitans sp.]
MTGFVHESASISPEAEVGPGTSVWEWSKIREGAKVGAGCVIGQGVYIDHGVVLGDGCKVQNGVSIYSGVTIGDRVFVGPHVTFTNDLSPRAFSVDWVIVPTEVEDMVSIGANATIVCGNRLGRGAMIGAGAVITSDVSPFALVVGNPAQVIDFVDEAGTRLHVGPGGGPQSIAGREKP